MRPSLVLAPVAMGATALAAPQLHVWPSSSPTKPASSQTTSTSDEPAGYSTARISTPILTSQALSPTMAASFDRSASENTASWTTRVTSIIVGEGSPDSWVPFSWGPWMLPPLEDITCSVTSSSVPSWESPDFPWIIPPRNHIRTDAPTSTSTAPLPQWTESALGRWGVQPRDGVTCVGTSSTSATSTFSPVPIWGGGGSSFPWGLPPQDDQVRTKAPELILTAAPSDWSTIFVTVVATATFASDGPGQLMSALISQSANEDEEEVVKRQLDVTTVTNTETGITTSTVVSGLLPEFNTPPSSLPSPMETDIGDLPLTTSRKAIPTLSATKGPDLVTASSAWVDGLPPPIPFESVILKTLTLDIPDHGTNVADTSTWFGPWPTSTELPFITSSIVTTPTTLLTLPKVTEMTASIPNLSSINCNEEYCGEDGTSYCFYWAGIVTMGQEGPEPGETRVPIGGCSVSGVPTRSLMG